MDSFEQKMQVFFEYLSENKVSVALEEINKVVNKKKGGSKFSDKQKLILSLAKAICLARANTQGEADSLFSEFLQSYAEFDSDLQPYSKLFFATAVYLSRPPSPRKAQRSEGLLRALLQEAPQRPQGLRRLPLALHRELGPADRPDALHEKLQRLRVAQRPAG